MISFIILHYKNLLDTKELITSILKIETKYQKSIVIVDNGTLEDKDIKELKKYNVDLVLNKENLGFAKGNNAGAKYAIEKYNPDFLCVINNDTLISQENFIDKIFEIYEETSFDMLGPKILTDNGESVNPFPAYKTLEDVLKAIKKHEKLKKIYKSKILRNLLKLYIKTKKIFKKGLHLENGTQNMYNVSLHGCAIIFSKKYYLKYEDIFFKETFLYHEEEFLEYRRQHDNLISYYCVDLEIFHKEGQALNNKFKENYAKLIFRNDEILKSLYLLKKVFEEEKKI